MSADDHAPRFYVGSVSGWAITDGNIHNTVSRPGGKDRQPISFYVHDRVYCHREIASFPAPDGVGARAGLRSFARYRRHAAEDLAAKLNAKHAELQS